MSVNLASSVLIADDDEDIRVLVSTILSKAGFHTDSFEGGKTALEAAKLRSPQVLVLDVRMPDMSGLEVCRALKSHEDTAGRPVLLISAESSSDDVAAAFEAGCDDYLPKPFSPRELVYRVDQLLARTA